MPNNPIQIVLNHTDFLRAKDPGRFGHPKDFFAGSNRAFIAHRNRLAGKLSDIKTMIEETEFGPAVYVRVVMRQEALAKSYRPNRALFKPELFPCVGAGSVGVLYFRLAAHYLDALIGRVREAEELPKTREKDGRVKEIVSQIRSEVGAILEFDVLDAQSKIMFDIETAVARFRDPATVSGYRIELYEKYAPQTQTDDLLGYRRLQQSFIETFMQLRPGVRGVLNRAAGKASLLELRITEDLETAPLLINESGLITSGLKPTEPTAVMNMEADQHRETLLSLAKHPLVKAIRPPLQVFLSNQTDEPIGVGDPLQLEEPAIGATYPSVGVIDSGVKADILEPWVIGRHDFLQINDYDGDHGSKVSGVVVAGQRMNHVEVAPETVGCQVYDIPLYPNAPFLTVFPDGFEQMAEEIAQAVSEAREEGVRVFNMSLNLDEVSDTNYGLAAARLDEIADSEDVIFVISAGNLPPTSMRSPWQSRPKDVIAYFAGRQATDRISQPAESVRSLAVGALNPPNRPHLEGAPTTYTRRGPGLQVGLKPDLCAFGGSLHGPGQLTGLQSCDHQSNICSVSGTSFSAPLVARTLAGLDHSTQGASSKETLRALMIHNARLPYPLTRQGISKQLGPQFGGFGQPPSATEILQTDDHAITFVFESRLTTLEPRPAMLRFPFTWPQALVNPNGSCNGFIQATLVYSPPLDPAFGAEFVRVNLNAAIRQRGERVTNDGEVKDTWESRITQRNLPSNSGAGLTEKALIKHGLKWWPTKTYSANLNGKGISSDWRIEVESLVRAEAVFPTEGIPFSLVITISDSNGVAPVFGQMQRNLATAAANMIDIRSRARVPVR